MLRYEGKYNVTCRKIIDGKMTSVEVGTIHARSRKEAKRESIKKFSVDCDTGRPVAKMVKEDGWFEQFKGFFRRGSNHKKTMSTTAIEREQKAYLRSLSGTPSVRKDISNTERKARRAKGKMARQSRRASK